MNFTLTSYVPNHFSHFGGNTIRIDAISMSSIHTTTFVIILILLIVKLKEEIQSKRFSNGWEYLEVSCTYNLLRSCSYNPMISPSMTITRKYLVCNTFPPKQHAPEI